MDVEDTVPTVVVEDVVDTDVVELVDVDVVEVVVTIGL